MQFKLDTNLDFAAIDVQRRVDTARVYMPTDLDPPLVDKSAGAQQAPILDARPEFETLSRTALSDLVEQRIVPDIRHIPNVQSVDARGEVKREYHVMPDPLRLIGTGATVADIFGAIAPNNATCPADGSTRRPPKRDVSIHSDIVRADDMLGIPLRRFRAARRRCSRIGDVATRRGRPRRAARRLEVQRRADDDAGPQPRHHRRRDQLDRRSRAHRSTRSPSSIRRSSSPRSRRRPTTPRPRSTACCRACSKASS